MSTSYPVTLDSLVNPQATDTLAAVSHSDQHANENDAIEALEATVGVTASAVTSSHDYRITQTETHVGRTDNPHGVTKTQVGLSNVDNTSDANKPISTATQTALDGKVDENVAITGATHTKISYDAKGLVTSGSDATTADIAASTNKNYVTDAQAVVIGNTSGTNTGDQTLPVKASGAEVDTGTDDAKFVTVKAINDSHNVPDVAPGTSGNLLTSNGTDWTSAAAPVSVSVTTKGDLQTFSTVPARLPVGTDGQILEARASETTGLKWIPAPSGNVSTDAIWDAKGDLAVGTGANTAAKLTAGADNKVLMTASGETTGLIWSDASSVAIVSGEVPSGTINSSNTAFTISTTPVSGSVKLYQNGVRLKITEDYTISGTAITMVTAPVTGDLLLVDYQTSTGLFATGSTSFVTNETPSGTVNGSNTVFTLVSTPVAGTLELYRDGVAKYVTNDYTLSTNTITFVTAPLTGSVLRASYQSAVSSAGNADTLDGQHAPTGTIVGTSDTQTLTNKTLTSPVIQGLWDFWVSANETWTYASASSFTIAGVDRTATFVKGTRLKWTQTTVKYGVVISSSFSTNTTVNIAINTDYTIANAAISANYYSGALLPSGYPTKFNYTPVNVAGSGSITTQTVTGSFSVLGNQCFTNVKIVLTTNGTGATDFRTTLPITADGVNYSGCGTDLNATLLLTVSIGVLSDTTKFDTRTSTGTYPGVTGHTYDMNLTYFF